MATKTIDNKGRLALGSSFANATVIVEEVDELEIRIVRACVLPQREVWLHQNKEAMDMVQKGLADAAAGKFVDGPDIDSNDAWIDELAD